MLSHGNVISSLLTVHSKPSELKNSLFVYSDKITPLSKTVL